MSRVVISDTSPLRYLVLIGQAEVLPSLYSEIFIPEAVASELRHAATPDVVRQWIEHVPSWLHIVTPTSVEGDVSIEGLDRGERDAISRGGQPLSEILDDFPTVSKEQAIAALEQAKEALLAHACSA